MTTIPDLIKDFIDTSKERLKTPISGAFLWAFIIWNWRPISILLFSKTAIEDRIYNINKEYCIPEAILWPVGIAFFYTVILPFIMWLIDWPVVYSKKIRLAKTYEAKQNILQEKIDIAEKVLELKNAENGNKEKQNLLDENNSLKEQLISVQESFKNMNESNNMTISSLNEQIKASNEERGKMSAQFSKLIEEQKFKSLHSTIVGDTLDLELSVIKQVLAIADILDFKEYKFLRDVDISEINEIRSFLNKDLNTTIENLIVKQVFTRNKKGILVLTEIGDIIYHIIKTS